MLALAAHILKLELKRSLKKAARGKQRVTYKRIPIRVLTDFSEETVQARRDWQEVFKVMKSKDLTPRLLYPEKLSFRMEGQIKVPLKLKEVKLKEFIITKPLLHEKLKGLKKKIKTMNFKKTTVLT